MVCMYFRASCNKNLKKNQPVVCVVCKEHEPVRTKPKMGGGVAESLGRWTCNPEVPSSSPLPDHLDL